MRRPNLLILLIIIALASCKKSGTKPVMPPAKTNDVYVVGYDQDNAVYWKNGKETILSKTVANVTFKSAEAHAMAVNNNDVYIVGVGTRSNGSNAALVWKNGVPDTLYTPPGTTGAVLGSRALSIAISGNDFYIGGDDYSAPQALPSGAAILWKNGVPTAFNGYCYSFSSILISNGDVYTAGCRKASQFNLFPIYFKNGTANAYHSTYFSWINDICVADTNVYIAGSEFLAPRYWKNGIEKYPLSGYNAGGDELTGITVLGKDVYYISNEGGLWKNDTLQKTSGPLGSHFAKIIINNKDIYITGYTDTLVNNTQQTVATIWKNGIGTRLSVYGSNAFGAYVH